MSFHSLGSLRDLHLATVIENADDAPRGRVRVRLHSTGLEAWAGVVVNSAGAGYGVSLIPRVDEQVVVAFVSPNFPLVLGALWSGADSAPDEAAPVQERYLIQTPAGIKVLLDDKAPRARIETPMGYHLTLDDQGGGSVTIEKGAEKIQMSPAGIVISTSAKVSVQASTVNVSAAMVTVDAGMSRFSGVVQCDTLISNAVVSASYTPGAGNIW